jgi:hypothetical protein
VDGKEQRILAGIVGIDGLLGDAGALGHLIHADSIVALLEECVSRGADDLGGLAHRFGRF